jgi:hypothetical protein
MISMSVLLVNSSMLGFTVRVVIVIILDDGSHRSIYGCFLLLCWTQYFFGWDFLQFYSSHGVIFVIMLFFRYRNLSILHTHPNVLSILIYWVRLILFGWYDWVSRLILVCSLAFRLFSPNFFRVRREVLSCIFMPVRWHPTFWW